MQNVENVIIATVRNSEEDKNMNLEILNMQKHEQQVIEEMKKYTDLFCEEKSLDQTVAVELKNTDRKGYFIHREDDRYVVEFQICAVHCFFFLE